MSCDKIPGLKLHDGATRIFLNTHGTDDEGVSEELIQLLRYFEQTTEENAAGSHSQKIENLQKRVEEIKKNEEVGIRYMNAFEEKMWERREGREEGEMIGGFGSEIARVCVEENADAPVQIIGLENRFITHGSVPELLRECGLTPEQLANRIEEIAGDKESSHVG